MIWITTGPSFGADAAFSVAFDLVAFGFDVDTVLGAALGAVLGTVLGAVLGAAVGFACDFAGFSLPLTLTFLVVSGVETLTLSGADWRFRFAML